MTDSDAWSRTWRRVGAKPPPGLLDELLARYAEPHRSYHTMQHLRECFATLEPASHLAARLGEVELALWFHDAIYDTRATDNEARSARWAEEALAAGGAGADTAARVRDLVLATRHTTAPEGEDTKLLVDVDLAILGAPEPRFAEYEAQVRQEYAWVPEDAFRQRRTRILQSFLDRPSIYSTPWFAERLEDRARTNLARSLRKLAA